MASVPTSSKARVRAIVALATTVVVGLAGTASVRPAPLAAPATVFTDGFESGSLGAWETVEGLSAVQTDASSGSWAAEAATDGQPAFAATPLPSPVADGSASLAFRVHDLTTRVTLLKLRAEDGSSITVGLNLRGDAFAFAQTAVTEVDADLPVTDDSWHRLDVRFVTGDAAWVEVELDGAVVKRLAVPDALAAPVDRIGIGMRRDEHVFHVGFDDVLVQAETTVPRPDEVVVAAAGDIACDPDDPAFNGGAGSSTRCRMGDTADLLTGADVVLPLGDIQYEDGALERYWRSYDPTWGRFLDVSRPVVGNHEYEQPGARDYFTYFGAAAGRAGQGWYSFDAGAWHVVALNSECEIVGCGPSSAQYAWLAADLAANDASCTLAYWHRPRFSSGEHGGDEAVAPLWELLDADGAELTLSGHDHHYERFAPQNAAGAATPDGMRAFVVGTGGKSLRETGTPSRNSVVRSGDSFGVLRLRLGADGYSWRFAPVPGMSLEDSGSDSCS